MTHLSRRRKLLIATSLVTLCAGTALRAQVNLAIDEYQRLSAAQKSEQLWSQVKATEYVIEGELPTASPPVGQLIAGLAPRYLHKTFLHESDFMPVGRKKVIHPYGVVGKIRFEVTQQRSPWTGFFRTGGIGMARLSIASFAGAFSPGIALKLLRDGQPSVNLLASYSLDGQGDDQDFFLHAFSTAIPKPEGAALQAGALAFRLAVRTLHNGPVNEITLPNDEAATYLPNGRTEQNPLVPYEVALVPTPEARQAFGASPDFLDFRERLMRIPSGTPLYQVVVRAEQGGLFEAVGIIRTQSELKPSSFGDEELFFQHPRRLD